MAYDIKTATILAKEALMILENESHLGELAYKGYSDEVGRVGSTIDIIVPPSFSANAMDYVDGVTIQDPDEDTIQMSLDQDYEVTFGVRDLEATLSDRNLLQQFMKPAILPLVEKMETTGMAALAHNITSQSCISGVTNANLDAGKIVDIRKAQRENKVPLMDQANLFGILSPADEAALLKQDEFTSATFGAEGSAIRRAFLGQRYGYNYFPTQLIERPTPTDTAGAVNNGAGYAAATTTLVVDALTAAPPEGTLATFAGHSSVYVVDAGSTTTSLKLKGSGLTDAVADNEVITFLNVNQNIFFHRNALGLAMRRKSKLASGESGGSAFATVEYNGYVLRIEIYRDSNRKKDIVSLDALWGWKLLQEELAFKYYTQK